MNLTPKLVMMKRAEDMLAQLHKNRTALRFLRGRLEYGSMAWNEAQNTLADTSELIRSIEDEMYPQDAA